MEIQFKIHDRVSHKLSPGFYDVFILGGFGVVASDSFHLSVDSSFRKVDVRKRFFKARVLKKWRRAVKFFEFEIDTEGEYFIHFQNPQGLTVRKSQLRMMRLFQKPIESSQIEAFIES